MIRRFALTLSLAAASLAAQEVAISPEPEIGQAIPQFSALDQNGERRDFDSLKGPNGLLLLFHRSADW